MDKWQRQEKGISTSYRPIAKEDNEPDAVGMTNADESYRILREGIDAMRDQAALVPSDQEEDTIPSKRTRNQFDQSEQEILRTRAGIILPPKNGFDFVEKPRSRVDMGVARQRKANSSMESIQSALNKLKKKNRGFQGNTKM